MAMGSSEQAWHSIPLIDDVAFDHSIVIVRVPKSKDALLYRSIVLMFIYTPRGHRFKGSL